MRSPFYNLLLFTVLVLAVACKPSSKTSVSTPTPFVQSSVQDWLGRYEGTMLMHFVGSKKPPHEVQMQLEIATTSKNNEWTWRVSYQDSVYGSVVKDYVLVQPDTLPKNAFWMDEKNGIFLSETLIDNTFYGTFELGNMFISSHTSKIADTIYYDIITMPNRATFTNVLTYNESVDTIWDYRTQGVQKAKLIKKK